MTANLSVDEIVQAIRRTQLPTVVCEGKDDVAIYRHIEESLGPTNVGLLPCGGRETLLSVYGRRAEFAGKTVVFFADKDMWLFSGVPREYSEILLTNGYSVENDVLRWDNIEKLMSRGEKARYDTACSHLAMWFACQVEKYLNGEQYVVADHVRRVLDMRTGRLRRDYCAAKGYRTPKAERVERIKENYRSEVRGKTLVELVLVFLSNPKRGSTYSRNNLIEMSIRLEFNAGLDDALTRIAEALGFPREELQV